MALTRRQFLHRSAAVAAVIGFPQVAAPSVLGANDAIRVGVVGCGKRGNHHIERFGTQEGVVVAAVCDPDRQRLAAAAKRIKDTFHKEPAQYVERARDDRQGTARCGFGGDDAVLARAAHDLGLPGRARTCTWKNR